MKSVTVTLPLYALDYGRSMLTKVHEKFRRGLLTIAGSYVETQVVREWRKPDHHVQQDLSAAYTVATDTAGLLAIGFLIQEVREIGKLGPVLISYDGEYTYAE